MLLLAATAASLATAPAQAPFAPVGATVQARAIVRIVSAVSLRLGVGPLRGEAPPVRDAVVHAEGSPRLARLIEFQ
jgi:hypothetical protein